MPDEWDTAELAALDKRHVWHPFTPMAAWCAPEHEPVFLVRGEGVWLWDSHGKCYLDGNSSIWTNIHGHGHPKLTAAIQNQAATLAHASFLGFSNPWATQLADRLVSFFPDSRLNRVFFSDDGSTAIECALKLAIQCRQLRGETDRMVFGAFSAAYHGDTLGASSLGGVPVFHDADLTPPKLAEKAYQTARKGGVSVVILDTAGRSQMDQDLMDELRAIEKKVPVTETILVVDAMIGQEALNVAQGFRQALPLSGLFLTKIDGDARGGAAISIREVTGIPIKFLGVGESIDAIEEYNPDRLASRILGMGDLLGLIEKAESAFDQQEAEKHAEKLMRGEFTLEDFAKQLKQMRTMGPLAQVMEMLPGQMGQVARQVDPREAEDQLKQIEAVINSMTVEERRSPKILNASRRRRIARGSGLEVQVVNQVMKRFRETQRLISTLQKSGGKGLGRLMG